jgi:Domain of unknown function (DUF2703)
MKVEVLYVADCPSHAGAVQMVKDILTAQGILHEVREVLVPDEQTARDLRFRGSPTIRINGRDIAGESQQDETFCLSCRLYPGSHHVGLPPTDLVRRAIITASKD